MLNDVFVDQFPKKSINTSIGVSLMRVYEWDLYWTLMSSLNVKLRILINHLLYLLRVNSEEASSVDGPCVYVDVSERQCCQVDCLSLQHCKDAFSHRCRPTVHCATGKNTNNVIQHTTFAVMSLAMHSSAIVCFDNIMSCWSETWNRCVAAVGHAWSIFIHQYRKNSTMDIAIQEN